MSAILEVYFHFDFHHIFIIGMLFCISMPNFIEIGPPQAAEE